MASRRSFQTEIPPSRVDIRYVRFVGNAQEKKELPLKLLLLGDFSQRSDGPPVEERPRIGVDKANLAQVMRQHALRLDVRSPDGAEEVSPAELRFSSFEDFTPAGIARQVPELARQLERRQSLRDLRVKAATNRRFRRALEAILADEEALAAVLSELETLVAVEVERDAEAV